VVAWLITRRGETPLRQPPTIANAQTSFGQIDSGITRSIAWLRPHRFSGIGVFAQAHLVGLRRLSGVTYERFCETE
jgi:hypothetical protein